MNIKEAKAQTNENGEIIRMLFVVVSWPLLKCKCNHVDIPKKVLCTCEIYCHSKTTIHFEVLYAYVYECV